MLEFFKKHFLNTPSPVLQQEPELGESVLDAADADAGLKIAGEHWGKRARHLAAENVPNSWSDCALITEEYINPKVSGSKSVGWLEAVARKHFPIPVELALSLGCGGGGLERHGLDLGIAKRFDAYDVSEGAIELAIEEATKTNRIDRIHYQLTNLNKHEFSAERYDAVFAAQSAHHIESLEHYMDQVQKTLKPGGLFCLNEFVGPTQFQWTDGQLFHANRLLNKIPSAYRVCIRHEGVVEKIERPTIDAMNAFDPTEAIRSEEIIPQLESRFDIIEQRPFGGTVLHLVLDNIVGNLAATEEGKQLLRELMKEEDNLIRTGELASDFTAVIARKRG